jgi:hypothetical protein
MLSPKLEEESEFNDSSTGIGKNNPKLWRRLKNQSERNRMSKRRRRARVRNRNAVRNAQQHYRLAKYHGKNKAMLAKKRFSDAMFGYYQKFPARLPGPPRYIPRQPVRKVFNPLLHVRFNGTKICTPTDEWDGNFAIAKWIESAPAYLYRGFGDFIYQHLSEHPSLVECWEELPAHNRIAELGYDLPDTTVLIRTTVSLTYNYISGKAVSVKSWSVISVYLMYAYRVQSTDLLKVYYLAFSGGASRFNGEPSSSDIKAQSSLLVTRATRIQSLFQGSFTLEELSADPITFNEDYWKRLLLTGLKYDEETLYHLSSKDVQRKAPKVLQDAIANSFLDTMKNGLPVMNQNALKTITLSLDCMKLLIQVKNGDLSAINDAIDHASRATGKPYAYFIRRFFSARKAKFKWDTHNGQDVLFIDATRRVFNPRSAAFSSTIDRSMVGKLEPIRQTWFSGRYIWSTNWMQMKGFYKYMANHALASLRHALFKAYSRYLTFDVDNPSARIKCQVFYREKVLQGLAKLSDRSYRLGIQPNRYVMWDMVPFSFVVDWFVPIGDGLAASDRYTMFSPLYVEYPQGYNYSIRYGYKISGIDCDVYFRFKQKTYPDFDLGSYILNWESAIKKKGLAYGLNGEAVVGQRLLDSIMLITQYL